MAKPDLLSLARRQRELLSNAMEKLDGLPETDRSVLQTEFQKLRDNIEALIETASAGAEEPDSSAPAREAARSAARMEAIFNNLSAGVLVYDAQGKVQVANSYAIALFGFDPVGMDRENLFRRVQVFDQHGDCISADCLPMTQAFAGEVIFNWPAALHNAQGRTYHVTASAMPIFAGQELQGVVSVWNDVSEQHNLLVETEQQKEVLEAIFAANPGGLAVISLPDMVYQMVNQAYQEITPDPSASPTGRTVAEVWSPEEQRRLQRKFRALVRSGDQCGETYQAVRPGAPGRYIESRFCRIRWKEQDAVLVVTWEITRLQQALKEAEEGRRILQALMEYVPEGITIADAPDVNIRMVSKYGQRLTGRPLEEITGIPAGLHPARWQIYSPKTNALVPAADLPLTRATQRGEVIDNEELILRRANGEEITILCSAGPIRDERGEITGGILAWRDISERKQVLQALKESEERFRVLADNMSQLAWMAEPDGSIFWYNRRWIDFTGAIMPNAAGWGWESLHHPDHLQRVVERYRQCFAAGEVWEDTFPLRGADGSYRWFLARAVPIYDGQGRVVRWFGTNTDITALRQAQEAVRSSERRFRVALAPVPITVFSMDCDLRYTWVYNPRFGFTEADALGRSDEEIFSPDGDIADLLAVKRYVIETGQPVQREVKMRVKGESYIFIVTLDPLVDESGAVVGLTGAALDVTEQRRLEARQLEFATEMEVQRRLLEHRELERQEIARDIHDGPIQSMVSALFNLQFAKDALIDEDAKAVIDQMMGTLKLTVQELREVVNQLRPPVLIRFGLSRAIEIHAEDLRARYTDLKIDLDLTQDESLLPETVCLALYRVYQEAMNNVVRHSHASHVWVRYYPAGDYMLLEIEDNGRGFNPPTDWVQYTRQNHFGVAGMRERVDAVGGRLKISSEPRKGTMVLVKVPLGRGLAGRAR